MSSQIYRVVGAGDCQCRGILRIRIIVEQGPAVLTVDRNRDFFVSPVLSIYFLSVFISETAQYRLIFRLKETVNSIDPTKK